MISGYRKELRCVPAWDPSQGRGWTREDVEYGGKILLPPSILEVLSRYSFSYPMLFRVSNPSTGRSTHCGVLEFTADDDTACLPSWIMRMLGVSADDQLTVESVSNFPVATYTRFKPLSTIFLDITDPKAVLENTLRHFACLTTGDVFAISYNNNIYEIEVEETRPARAVSIIECDMEVDFSPPVDYTEPAREAAPAPAHSDVSGPKKFRPFAGQGVRLDGKVQKVTDAKPARQVEEEEEEGIPDYDYKVGTVTYMRDVHRTPKKQPKEEFKSFSGPGRSLDDSSGPK